mmetsp:Transcript_25566/g.37769  ORF Transcript_25566/g.37769 Transcript_25566/m.37769 type:complete len:275 (+) Transcript_25566:138-962(+)
MAASSDIEVESFKQISLVIDENSFIVEYACHQPSGQVNTEHKGVSFSYDLLFHESEDPSFARKYFESLLLKKIAIQYDLYNGMACVVRPNEYNNTIFFNLIQISSLQDNLDMNSCVTLTPTGGNQSCYSFIGTITGGFEGVANMPNIMDFVEHTIDDGELISGSTLLLESAFLWKQFQPTPNTSPSKNITDESNEKGISFVSIIIIAALAGALTLSIVGIWYAVWRQQKSRKTIRQLEFLLEKERIEKELLIKAAEEGERSWFSAPYTRRKAKG